MMYRPFAVVTTAIFLLASALMGWASDIDNCCFINRQCQTDQQWTDGYWAFQNNQCPAPVQSQAVASAPTVGVPAQIDNCCFIDRQCQTDQQWTDGYWAFQRGQCAPPVQTLAPASSQLASGVIARTANAIIIGYPGESSILPSTSFILGGAPGEIISFYNCCEANWQCNSEQDWAAGYYAMQKFECALPGRAVSIVGDAEFIEFYTGRLDELKHKLPHRYDYVLAGLDRIEQDDCQPTCSFGLNEVISTFHAYWYPPYVNGWEKRESAVLVHEACHVHRYYAGHRPEGQCDPERFWREETICREMELAVVIELGAPSHVIEATRSMVAATRARNTGEVPCREW